MIHDPFALVAILLCIETLVFYVSGHERLKKYFKYIPSVFWIYFIPMVCSSLGLIDARQDIFKLLSANLLPVALFILLLSSDVSGIVRCGRPALIMMFAGSLGIMAGVPLVFFFFQRIVGPQFWPGFGALSGSWIGGSANMIAVKEAIAAPEPVFLPMVIVDTIVPYAWMGLLVAMAAMQPVFDRWSRADTRIITDLARKNLPAAGAQVRPPRISSVPVILAVGCAGALAARFLAGFLPEIENVISNAAWTIIIVSLLGVTGSLTPLKKLEAAGASRTGYFVLYLVLASIGARAGAVNIGPVAMLIVAGFLIVSFQGIVLLITARLIRAPLALAAVASQANIGGVASAPILATIYHPDLAPIGLLLAVCGNITGTYLGIITSQLCRMVAGL